MPETRRPARAAKQRAATRPAKSPVPSPPQESVVIGAFLRGQPELTLLTKAVAGARLELVDDRLALVATVLATRPGLVVLPPFDVAHTSTAPLVLRLRREVPRVPVLILAAHPSACGQPLLRAVQAGAQAITSPTPAQLREALSALLEPDVRGH